MSNNDEWKHAKDAKGRVYYYNTKTNKSQWDKPQELFNEQELHLYKHGWKINRTPEGKVYYYHVKSGESRWNIPQFEEEENKPDNVSQHDSSVDNTVKTTDVAAVQAAAATVLSKGNEKYANPSKILNPPKKSKEEAESEFIAMLEENQVDSTWSFSKIISDLGARDPRYWMVDDDPLWKQQIFEKYLTNRSEDQLLRERAETEKFKDAFWQMLKSKSQIKYYTRWPTARRLISNEPIYKHSVVREVVKRRTFLDYIASLREENEASDRTLKAQALSELKEYLHNILFNDDKQLKNTEELPVMSWQHLLNNYLFEKNKRFMANKHFKILNHEDVLNAYMEILENEVGAMQDKLKLLNDRCYTKDRIARDNFKALLRRPDLNIRADSKWKDIYPLFKSEDAFLRMLGTSGSSALDIFLDYVEELDITLSAHRSMAQTLLIDKKFDWDKNNTDGEHNRRTILKLLKDDSGFKSIDEYDMNLIIDQLISLRDEKLKHQHEMEQRMQDQKKHFFKFMLQRVYRNVAIKPDWSIAREQLKDTVEFKELSSDENLLANLYEEFISSSASGATHLNTGVSKEAKKRALTPTVELDY